MSEKQAAYNVNPISLEQREEIQKYVEIIRLNGFPLHWFMDFKVEKLLQRAPYWLDLLLSSEQALLKENEQLEKQRDNCRIAALEAQSKVSGWREIITAHNAKLSNYETHNTQHWAWMPDEDNYLETLSAPVLIPAEWLRNLISDGEKTLREDNVKLIEFAKRLINDGFHGDVYGTDIRDLAVHHGLLVKTEYDPELHGESDVCDKGDTYYILSDTLSSLSQRTEDMP